MPHPDFRKHLAWIWTRAYDDAPRRWPWLLAMLGLSLVILAIKESVR